MRMTTTANRLCVGLVIACAILTSVASAQQANLNIEGVVRDETSGQPVGCKILIKAPSGKKITITSNSKDGTYLQTLSESGTHKLSLSGYNIYRKDVDIEIPVAQRYRIIKQDITVKLVVEGTPIFSIDRGFEKNSAVVTEQAKKQIADLAETLRANQEMNVVVGVSPDEDQLAPLKAKTDAEFKKQYDAWLKATKKVKKGQTPPVEPVRPADPVDPNSQLVQDRISSVKQLVKEVRSGDVRISYVTVPLSVATTTQPATAPAATKSKKKGKKTATPAATPVATTTASQPTLTAKVGKVKKLYD